MPLNPKATAACERWRLLTIYEKFEHAVLIVLTWLIALVIAAAVVQLAFRVIVDLVLTGRGAI